MIQIRGPDGAIINFPDGTNPAVIRDAMARHYGGEGATRTFAPPPGMHPQGIMATADPRGDAGAPQTHPQSQDWWRSITGGLVQGANGAAAPIGGADDLTDHLAEMAAKGGHDFGQMIGLVPKDQPYHPGQGAAWTQIMRNPGNLAGGAVHAFGGSPPAARAVAAGINTAFHGIDPVEPEMHQIHPSTWHDAEVGIGQALAGAPGAAAVRDVVDYEPQTATGRVLHRGASFLPGAGLPGSTAQRVLAVAAPTVGATIGGEGARAMGASPETVSDAELLATLLGAGAGGASVKPVEGALTNAGDMLAGPRAIPTSGRTADLITLLRGGAGGPIGDDAATFKRSDLQGAARILAQHVSRVSRANGEDFGAMGARVGGMGDQGMLADALPDLARNVADRGSFGQQFLGNQLNNRQLGVFDPSTGVYSEPSAAMRLDAARRNALGVPAGAFDTTQALTKAQEANAGPLYDAFRAEPAVSTDAIADFRGPDFNNAYGRAATIARRNFAPIPDQPGPYIDPQTLNLVKQGFDDLASEGQLQGIGANEQGSARNFAQAFRGRLDELYPDTYPQARAAYAGPAAVKDAIDFGRGAYTMDPAELAAGLADLSQSERQGANVGFYQAGRDTTLGRSQRLNAAEALGATNPDMMARNQALMGDNFGDWNTTLGNEGTFFNTRSRALGGSATSRNMLGAEDTAAGEGVNPFEATAGLVRAAHGDLDGVVETGGNLGKLFGLGKLFAPKPSQMTEGTADVLGTVLGTRGAFTDPQTADLIQALMDSAKTPNFNAGIVRPAAVLGAPKSQDQGGQ